MTRDEIIRMAREAGLYGFRVPTDSSVSAAERFAALVAAAERQRILQTVPSDWCASYDAFKSARSLPDDAPALMYAFAAGMSHEREACAQMCESDWTNVVERMYGNECAAAIRARSNK